MNRTGLAIALAVAAVVGVLFGVYPRFDLDLAALFFDPNTHSFGAKYQHWTVRAREVAEWLIAALAAVGFVALAGKLVAPRQRMPMRGRAGMLMLVTLALGPGLLANTVLKDHWGRARPIDVVQFGGPYSFTPWWDPRGSCAVNCSFIAGEPSGAFWTLVPAALTPPQWRPFAYGAALAFGVGVGALRMSAGGHFFTDIVFAGVLMFLLGWFLHGIVYRWRATRITDEAVERPLVQAGEPLRRALAALASMARRISGRPSERS